MSRAGAFLVGVALGVVAAGAVGFVGVERARARAAALQVTRDALADSTAIARAAAESATARADSTAALYAAAVLNAAREVAKLGSAETRVARLTAAAASGVDSLVALVAPGPVRLALRPAVERERAAVADGHDIWRQRYSLEGLLRRQAELVIDAQGAALEARALELGAMRAELAVADSLAATWERASRLTAFGISVPGWVGVAVGAGLGLGVGIVLGRGSR